MNQDRDLLRDLDVVVLGGDLDVWHPKLPDGQRIVRQVTPLRGVPSSPASTGGGRSVRDESGRALAEGCRVPIDDGVPHGGGFLQP